MGKIYKNQTALRISLDTKADLSTATAQVIKYKKPDRAEGSFTATKDVSTNAIYYDVTSASDIDQIGTWKFWAYITFTGGKVAAGESTTVIVHEQGT